MISPQDSSLKCTTSNVFITITLDDKLQSVPSRTVQTNNPIKPRQREINRLKRISAQLTNNIVPYLDDFMGDYAVVTELSEAMASKGKYYPRLHFHILGYLACPIAMLLAMGDLTNMGYGYHIINDLNGKEFDVKQEYINKQRKQWRKFLSRRNYVALKLSNQRKVKA